MSFSRKRNIRSRMLFMLSLGLCLPSAFSYSASDAECGIWMCLPAGFGTGCSEAHKAFIDRIKDFKSPLPDFSSCMVGSNNSNPAEFTSRNGYAAYIPPGNYIHHQRCERKRKDEPLTPKGCTRTYKFTQVYHNGVPIGDTYYY